MAKKGKFFEQLVKTVEKQLKNKTDYNIRSNVMLKNSNGIDREFDVVVEHISDESVGKTVIECKAHKAPIDIQYIDGFYGKCSNVSGITRRILVSSSGFTKNAQTEAKSKGIELCELGNLSVNEDAPQYEASIGGFKYWPYSDYLYYTTEDSDEPCPIPIELVKDINSALQHDFYAMVTQSLGQDSFIKGLLETLYANHIEELDTLALIEEPFTIITEKENIDVASLGFLVHAETHFVSQKIVSQKKYGDYNTIISDFEVKEIGLKTTLIRDKDSMQMYYNDDSSLTPLEPM